MKTFQKNMLMAMALMAGAGGFAASANAEDVRVSTHGEPVRVVTNGQPVHVDSHGQPVRVEVKPVHGGRARVVHVVPVRGGRRDMFSQLDMNRNGAVTRWEFIQRYGDNRAAMKTFNRLDVNHSGKLSRDEVARGQGWLVRLHRA